MSSMDTAVRRECATMVIRPSVASSAVAPASCSDLLGKSLALPCIAPVGICGWYKRFLSETPRIDRTLPNANLDANPRVFAKI